MRDDQDRHRRRRHQYRRGRHGRDRGDRRRQGGDDGGRDVRRGGGAEFRARGFGDEGRGDRRRHDRHHPFHQCRGAAARSRADRGRASRPAGHGLAAADGRLAGGPQKRNRKPCLSRAWRARVRRARDFSARRGRTARHRRGHQSQGHSLDRDHVGVQSGQHRARNQGRSDFRKGAAGRSCHFVERHRPHRAAGARERGGDERVPTRSRQARHRRVSHRARRLRRQGAVFPDPERRHADGRRLCRAVSGAHLRQRADQFDSRRRVSLRRRRGDRRRCRRNDHGRRRAAQGLSAAGDRRGGGRRRQDQLPHARRLLVRTRRRIARGRRPGGSSRSVRLRSVTD